MQVSLPDVDNQNLNAVYEWRSPQGNLLGLSNIILPFISSYAVGANVIGIHSRDHINGGSATQSDVVTILNTIQPLAVLQVFLLHLVLLQQGVLTCSASFSDYNDGSLSPTFFVDATGWNTTCRCWKHTHHRSKYHQSNR